MSKRAAIPIDRTGNTRLDRTLAALKENVDAITGQQRTATRLQTLDPSTATAADCAELLNQIVERLQGSE